jgi:hypothetical protein
MNPHEPRVLLRYIEWAEALLEDRAQTNARLVREDRERLERHLAEAKALAAKMDVNYLTPMGEVNTLMAFTLLLGSLGPRLATIKRRAAFDAGEIARRGKQARLENIDLAIAEEMKTGGKTMDVRKRVNERLVALGWPVISSKVFYERWKRIRDSRIDRT